MKLETKAPVQSRFATPASASPSGGRLDDLPAPRTSRGGHKLGCLALLALLLVAGAAVWLTRNDATRDAWRKDAVTWLDAKLEGTALAPLMNLLRETPRWPVPRCRGRSVPWSGRTSYPPGPSRPSPQGRKPKSASILRTAVCSPLSWMTLPDMCWSASRAAVSI